MFLQELLNATEIPACAGMTAFFGFRAAIGVSYKGCRPSENAVSAQPKSKNRQNVDCQQTPNNGLPFLYKP
ncbi:TPA: hypothetical protein ACFNMI_000487 [Neisseria bacilliformis]